MTSKSTIPPMSKKALRLAKKQGTSYRSIAAAIGVNHRWICDLAVRGIAPKSPTIRAKMGLPPLPLVIPTKACAIHGIVHKQRCPSLAPRTKPRAPRWGWLWDVPERELRAMLENRVEWE